MKKYVLENLWEVQRGVEKLDDDGCWCFTLSVKPVKCLPKICLFLLYLFLLILIKACEPEHQKKI